jgi:hypothetical protein
MAMNNNPFNFIELGVIASGGDPKGQGQKKGDHPKDHSGNQKVILPSTMDPDGVKQEHLAFSPLMHSPTALGQQSFQGTMDPGALVYFLKFPGQNGGVILGQANDIVNYDKGTQGGGKNLLGHQYFQDLFDRETGVNIPPDIEEAEEKGAKVKKIKEKGKKHKHSLLKGTPSHGAMFETSGYKLPEVNNVPTAKQQFSNLLTGDMMNNMPGSVMSLGGMFQGLMGGMGGAGGGGGGGGGAGGAGGSPQQGNLQTSLSYNRLDEVKQNLTPEMQDALTSVATMSQGLSPNSTYSSYGSTFRVHEETYLDNAAELLGQVTCLEDLMSVLNRLQHDETLFGLDQLANTVITANTTWGTANTIITPTGDVQTQYANTAPQQNMNNNLSNPSSNPGSGSGQNMFGDKISSLMDMMKRLPPNSEGQMKKLMQGMNSDSDLMQIVKQTIEGGNPLSKFMS